MATIPVKPNEKNSKRVAEGRKNVKKRSDYQVQDQLDDMVVLKQRTPHHLRIAKYRDRLMAALNGKIPAALFEKIDGRSLAMLDKLPDNTEIAHYSGLCQYVEYCNTLGNPPLPFHGYAVDAYLSHLMAQGRKRSVIDVRVATLVAWANLLELDDPRASFKVKTRLAEIRKKVKNKPRQAEGIRVAHLQRAIDEQLKLFDPAIPRDCQDVALLFVAFETKCRQSEMVSFDWEDFTLDADGTGLLHLDCSKTDQDGAGAYLYLSPNTVELLLGWQTVSGKRSGAIFRGVYSNGKLGQRLSARGMARCAKRLASRLGLNASVFSGHSTRVGSAQEMVERNIDSAKIMLSGRWKTMAMLVKYSEKIDSKRSAMADLAEQLGWDGPHNDSRLWGGLSRAKAASYIEETPSSNLSETGDKG